MQPEPRLVIAVAMQLVEPTGSSEHLRRVRHAESFLSGPFATFCLHTLENDPAISWNFIRYIDPTHLAPVAGIAVLLRVLGPTHDLTRVKGLIDDWLANTRDSAGIALHHWLPDGDWAATNHANYGGPATADEFAEFMHASSVLALRLLRDSQLRPERDWILAGWRHCFNFMTVGYDWELNGPPSTDHAAV